jgi:2-keto-3-deoxy-6-phosphogluconate aldolase
MLLGVPVARSLFDRNPSGHLLHFYELRNLDGLDGLRGLFSAVAFELGADFIKIYPVATVGGPAYVTNVRRALQLLPLVVTGNIEYDEIPQYLKAGVVGFGIGGPLIPADVLARGDHEALVTNARRFLAATRS